MVGSDDADAGTVADSEARWVVGRNGRGVSPELNKRCCGIWFKF